MNILKRDVASIVVLLLAVTLHASDVLPAMPDYSDSTQWYVQDRHADQDEDHEDQRKAGSEPAVRSGGELLLDDVADQEHFAAAEDVGHDECRQGRHEDHCDP